MLRAKISPKKQVHRPLYYYIIQVGRIDSEGLCSTCRPWHTIGFYTGRLKHSIMKTIISISIALALALSFAGCEPGGVIVTARPEVPYYERPFQPGPDYIWIDGDWVWVGGRYVYRNGHWDHPHPNRHWEGGRWEQHGDGWKWRRGRWH